MENVCFFFVELFKMKSLYIFKKNHKNNENAYSIDFVILVAVVMQNVLDLINIICHAGG